MDLDDIFGGFSGDSNLLATDFLADIGSLPQDEAASASVEPEVAAPQETAVQRRIPQPAVPISPEDAEFLAEVEFPVPQIQNIIASVHLMTELDLRRIAISARTAEYNPRKVNAVVIRLRGPKCTGLVFRHGRMMVTGAKCIEDAKRGGKKMAKLCQKAGHPEVRFHGFKVENFIATADCNFPVRLEGLAHDHKEFSSYEAELFPGLVYRFTAAEDCKAVLLVFSSGKVIITGCRTASEVLEVFNATFPVLVQYRK